MINRFLGLLALLVLYISLAPFLEGTVRLKIIMDCVLSAVLISSIFAVSHKKWDVVFSALLAGPLLIGLWTRYFYKTNFLTLFIGVFVILFMGYLAIIFLRFIFEQEEVDSSTIYASIVTYILAGIMWSAVYSILETMIPGSFSASSRPIDSSGTRFIYYSFVTITTLGYGDIIPATSKAGALSIIEAITGQFYLAVLVARLVGIHISQSILKQES
jgi:voltage-gated potassium channel